MVSDKTGVPKGLPEPPGEVMGLIGPDGRERAAAQEVARPPLMGSPNRTRRGGAAPLSLSLVGERCRKQKISYGFTKIHL